MVHITGNFLAESPLSPKAREALNDAMEQGWGDPRKLAHSAAKVRILHEASLASLAENLGLRADEVEILGEPALGYFYSICGLLRPEETLIYSSVDRKEVFAIARSHQKSTELSVETSGRISPEALAEHGRASGVFALQVANGETGVSQDIEALIGHSGNLRLACDFSSAATRVPLPSRWDSAFFDAKSWQGPHGIGIVAIRNNSKWKNPLPHLGSTRTPQSASLPLAIAAAVALEEWRDREKEEGSRLRTLTREFRKTIGASVEYCDIAGDLDDSMPHITSLSFLYVQGEELLRKLETDGFAVDSGSACTAEDLQPSHVLAAMGVLTHGNIRITLHHGANASEVHNLATSIVNAVRDLRAV